MCVCGEVKSGKGSRSSVCCLLKHLWPGSKVLIDKNCVWSLFTGQRSDCTTHFWSLPWSLDSIFILVANVAISPTLPVFGNKRLLINPWLAFFSFPLLVFSIILFRTKRRTAGWWKYIFSSQEETDKSWWFMIGLAYNPPISCDKVVEINCTALCARTQVCCIAAPYTGAQNLWWRPQPPSWAVLQTHSLVPRPNTLVTTFLYLHRILAVLSCFTNTPLQTLLSTPSNLLKPRERLQRLCFYRGIPPWGVLYS